MTEIEHAPPEDRVEALVRSAEKCFDLLTRAALGRLDLNDEDRLLVAQAAAEAAILKSYRAFRLRSQMSRNQTWVVEDINLTELLAPLGASHRVRLVTEHGNDKEGRKRVAPRLHEPARRILLDETSLVIRGDDEIFRGDMNLVDLHCEIVQIVDIFDQLHMLRLQAEITQVCKERGMTIPDFSDQKCLLQRPSRPLRLTAK